MSHVRVGIVSWNTAALLDACLTALPAALDGLDAEVVVVDNGSTDESADVVRRHPSVRLHALGENLGYARGMNRALAGARAGVLIALNPDTAPPPESLRRLVEALEADPRAAVVAPRLVGVDGELQHSVHRFPSVRIAAALNLLPVRALRGRMGRRMWVEGTADHHEAGPVDWAIGAVHVMRTDAVGAQPYSERWFMYVEDLDLCWRMRAHGWEVVLHPEVAIPHVGNAAGEQRWGADRTRRWLEPSYDWFAQVHGVGRTRAFALCNLVGAVVKGSAATVRGRVRSNGGARAWGQELWAVVPTHLRAVAHPDRIYEPDARPA